ncbi:MAG: DNA polymerase III subunit gamma/tau [Verrucomicrobia bacterium]|nr:DNA polymerase III subunit gamma/tau [Verrucomicrobiota bacterium]
MAYQVIARKYRPQRFADVVGQEHVTQTLTNAIRQNRIAHAYLFCGPRGTGKTTIARIFAKCLNCTGGPRVDFDDDDPKCREIAEGRSMDVLEIDGASNNGVEQVRELRETVQYAPASSRFKIVIIDEVHMLSVSAFNALLKTLEEPPPHVKFMFATTDPEKVLTTILSRCQRFDLRRIPAALIVQHLAKIARKEGVTLDEAALYAIARGADGGMRDAESTLDQLISFCGNEITEADVLAMFGLAARTQLLELAGAVLKGDAHRALSVFEELARNGKDLGRLLGDLLNHFRNLLVFQVSDGDLELLEISELEAAALKEQANSLGAEAVTRVLEVLSDAEGRLREAISKKILLEVTLLRAIEARNAASVDQLLKRLGELRAAAESAPATAPAPVPPPKPAPAAVAKTAPALRAASPAPALNEVPSASVGARDENGADEPPGAAVGGELGALWASLLEAVGRVSPFARSYLVKAFPAGFDGKTFTIGFEPEFEEYLGLVDSSKNRALVKTKLKELGAGDAEVRFVKAPRPVGPSAAPRTEPVPPAPERVSAPPSANAAASPAPRPRTEKLDPADFKNDPLIKEALEIFRGQIVEVRR